MDFYFTNADAVSTSGIYKLTLPAATVTQVINLFSQNYDNPKYIQVVGTKLYYDTTADHSDFNPQLWSVNLDGTGNVLVAEETTNLVMDGFCLEPSGNSFLAVSHPGVFRITTAGVVSTVNADVSSKFTLVRNVICAGGTSYLIGDHVTNGATIIKMDPSTGTLSTTVTNASFTQARGICLDPSTNLLWMTQQRISDNVAGLQAFTLTPSASGSFLASPTTHYFSGISIPGDGFSYMAGNDGIVRKNPVGSSSYTTVYTGTATTYGFTSASSGSSSLATRTFGGLYPWGETNKIWYLSAVPSLASDGPFQVGDWIVNTAPSSGGTAFWVCTAAGTGVTGTFKGVSNS